MQMQMNGWTQFERQVRWSEVFHHVEDLRLYLLLKSDAMVKDEVPCGELVLNAGQYVRSITLLREDLWFYNVKKKDFYSHSRIQRSIKRLEKLGLITAERFPHGFLFTVLGVEEPADGRELAEMDVEEPADGRELAEVEAKNTAEVQAENGQDPFLPPARESDVEDSRIEPEDTIEKRNKREKRKNKNNNNNSISEDVRRAKIAAVAEHFMVRRGKGFFLTAMDLTAIERICESPLSTEQLTAFMDEQFDKVEQGSVHDTINSPKYLEKILESYEPPEVLELRLEEALAALGERVENA
ncbi:hypothetical protein [Bacillus infantis]|uniref:Uncharacterized protein n=1 Tax=Bacillus infantis TaxID=324767 RepID=A0A5D4RIS4_9BACI|nr:hypothetical protein [Bacillus infantis]TYS51197.1 hypothetical protein FZD51_03935 [Bacillus infantis]